MMGSELKMIIKNHHQEHCECNPVVGLAAYRVALDPRKHEKAVEPTTQSLMIRAEQLFGSAGGK